MSMIYLKEMDRMKAEEKDYTLRNVTVINFETRKNFKLYLDSFSGIVTDRVHLLNDDTKEIWEPIYKEAGFKILSIGYNRSIAYESEKALEKVDLLEL